MREIWKFPLRTVGETWISIPSVWRGLTAQFQDGQLCLWAIVDPKAVPIQLHVLVIGTGWSRDLDGWTYLSTVQDAPFVWHVFVPSEDSI